MKNIMGRIKMGHVRTIKKIFISLSTMEGAGVHLKRVFGFPQIPELDPFLLMDDFHSNDPAKYIKGFPWHPHRGIETISYIIQGEVEHSDSMGNTGVIQTGDVQWMTAGNGIVHQEMPKGDDQNRLWGFQLWANLPASHKMMPPRYQEIKKNEIPEITQNNGISIKVIAGTVNGTEGPVKDIVIDPEYLDVSMPPDTTFEHKTTGGHKVFAYIIDGNGYFDPEQSENQDKETLIIFEDGDHLVISTKDLNVRFLLISGKPIEEPIAWHGPIVMNTDEELEIAFREYQNGTFLNQQNE